MKIKIMGFLIIGSFVLAIPMSGCGQEGSQEVSKQPQATPTTTVAKPQRFILWKEPKEDAFYGLIPKGWSAQGEVARPYLDAAFQFEAKADAQGTRAFFFYAPLPYAFVEPNSVLSMYGNTEGTWWIVPYTSYKYYVYHYLPGGQYVKSYLLPNLKRQFPDARIEKIVDRPDLSRIYRGYATEQYDAADVVITYTMGGTKIKVGYTIITRQIYVPMGMGVNFGIWGVYMRGCHGPEHEFEKIQSLYTAFIPTFRVNKEWMGREIAAQRQRQQIISGTMRRIMEMDYKIWTEESESRMKVARGWMNALGGTEDYVNPDTREKYTLPVMPRANFYWQKGTEFVATELDRTPDIGYTRLEEAR